MLIETFLGAGQQAAETRKESDAERTRPASSLPVSPCLDERERKTSDKVIESMPSITEFMCQSLVNSLLNGSILCSKLDVVVVRFI